MKAKNLPIIFLGTVLYNLTPQEAAEAILHLIDEYGQNSPPQYIATVNVDFIVNANCMSWKGGRDVELLGILRQARLATIDGMPIVWACRLLGVSLSERLTGIDLFPVLLKELEKRNKSIFLLGGQEKVLKLCKLFLNTEYPELSVKGTAAPKIDCKGEFLEHSPDQDRLILEQIHAAKPDVLFINLGNPKQELWYNRVKKQLQVPVSLGIGGTLDLFTEVIPRAPLWMRNSGLEWLFRLMQEPKRLGRRYLKDLFHFPCLILPAIAFHNLNKLFSKNPFHSSNTLLSAESRLFISSKHTLSFTSLYALDEYAQVKALDDSLEDIFSPDAIVLDFASINHISLEGLALLLKFSQRAWKENKPLYFINLKARLKWLAKVHRLDDVIYAHLCNSIEDLYIRLHQAGFSSTFYDSVQQGPQSVIISFFGKLDDQLYHKEYLHKLMPMMEKNCIIDLRYCNYIDQSALGLLLKIRKIQKKHGRLFELQNIPPAIKQKLIQTQTYELFVP